VTEAEDAIRAVVAEMTPEQTRAALEGLLVHLRYECPPTKRPPVGHCNDKQHSTHEHCARCWCAEASTRRAERYDTR
jgi:hypothetical protein